MLQMFQLLCRKPNRHDAAQHVKEALSLFLTHSLFNINLEKSVFSVEIGKLTTHILCFCKNSFGKNRNELK